MARLMVALDRKQACAAMFAKEQTLSSQEAAASSERSCTPRGARKRQPADNVLDSPMSLRGRLRPP